MIDSHAHLYMPEFDADREEMFARSVDVGVTEWIVPAVTPRIAREVLAAEWRKSRPGVHVAVGVHPHETEEAPDEWLEELEELLRTRPEIVAVGETGLDLHYGADFEAKQMRFLEKHLELAARFEKPVILHCRSGKRDAFEKILPLIESARVKGVFHCFTGGFTEALRAVAAGWYVSFSGVITFKKSHDLRAIAAALPLDRLLVETDAPYLAPEPYRGKRNEPSYLLSTFDLILSLHALAAEEAEHRLEANVRRLFPLTASSRVL